MNYWLLTLSWFVLGSLILLTLFVCVSVHIIFELLWNKKKIELLQGIYTKKAGHKIKIRFSYIIFKVEDGLLWLKFEIINLFSSMEYVTM